jgi:hypothetical protein
MKQQFTREQRTTIVYGVLCLVLFVVVLQLWLLTATMNGYLGGDETLIVPAAIVSLVCYLLVARLLRSVSNMERQER